MFFILLESISIYGNLNDTILLVYTSTVFMNKIKNSHLFHENIKFEINDTYDTIDKACKARLDLFQLPLSEYDKILYLDTDILIKDDLQKVFDVCKEDVLYVLEEGTIDHEYHGKTLFGDEKYEDISAFTSGILLFNNCEKIKDLFQKIKEDIVNRPYDFVCHDQPYIVYNAFKYKLYDNKLLKALVVNNDSNIHSDKVIHHFPGGPGVYQHKIDEMMAFLNRCKVFMVNKHIDETKTYIDSYLLPLIKKSGELLEGNIFMVHQTTEYTESNKAINISSLILNKNIKKVMEIGFNAGFSTLLMLLTNPIVQVTCFDLGEHKYTLPCYEKLKDTFGDRINIVIGDSTKTLGQVNDTYDLIHIDGGHTTDVANSDIQHSYRLSRKGTILIMDDYDFPNLNKLWNYFVKKYQMKPLDSITYECNKHDIKYVTYNIPKILFQTNKTVPEKYVLDMILTQLTTEWSYQFYTDEKVIKFFEENPIQGLPDIIHRYNSIKSVAHRADLFRYYYLYIHGGVFMDSDAMLYVNIDTIVKEYDFISVNSHMPETIFQGVLGACPQNNIIKQALINAYTVEPSILESDYFYFTKVLYQIIKEDDSGYNIKLYEEEIEKGICNVVDENHLLFVHYFKDKVIPLTISEVGVPYTDWDNYNKSELEYFDYSILTTYVIPNKLIRLGPNSDGGYVIADGFNYDLFISCGIEKDIRFEEAFLNIHKIRCVAFDGTIQSIPPHRNNIEWIPKNIGYSNNEKTTNLKEYMNHDKIFLKMDIEGCEFNWLDSMTETELDHFSQIVIEYHWPFDMYRMNMLKKLNKTHYIIHIHGNNCCNKKITIQHSKQPPIELPQVFEVTYINKKLCYSSTIEEIQFPTIVDYPNNPYEKDMSFSIPVNLLENKIYTWGNSSIKFLDHFEMDAFGKGTYKTIDNKVIVAFFGGREHCITFNKEYTLFTSVRKDDLDIVNGKLL